MTAHEYLSQYLALQADIERWKRVSVDVARADDAYLAGARLTASYSDMPRSGQSADLVAIVGSYFAQSGINHERICAKKIVEAREAQMKIVHAIDAVPINLARQILDLKYLQGYTLQEIADTIKPSVSVSTVRRLVGQGLSWIVFPEIEASEILERFGTIWNDLKQFETD